MIISQAQNRRVIQDFILKLQREWRFENIMQTDYEST